MLKKSLLSICLLFITATLWSQDYVVTLQKDTLYGDIDILLPEEFSEDIILNSDDGKKRFKSFQIFSAVIDSSVYQPVKHQNKYRLMKRVKSGYLSLYLFRPDETYDFTSKYLLKTTQEGMEIPNLSFKKRITDFLSDCPAVVTKIEDKTYKKADLNVIIDAYNQCLQQKTDARYASHAKKTQPDDEAALPNKEEDQPKVDLINALKLKLGNNATELNTLLDDILSKINGNQEIPSYMIGALRSQTKGMEAIQDEVNELIEIIN